jgi:hypothetical protein
MRPKPLIPTRTIYLPTSENKKINKPQRCRRPILSAATALLC